MAQATSSAGRVRRRRDKLREQGMRPLQIWIPDTRSSGFAEEYARQLQLVAASYTEEDLQWLDDNLDEMLSILDAAEQQRS
jgi:hypothetical protein